MGYSKWNDVRIHVEKILTYSEDSVLGVECMENISTLVLSLTGSFFICRSAAGKICIFERVLNFRNIHFPSLKISTAPRSRVRDKSSNAYLHFCKDLFTFQIVRKYHLLFYC